MFKRPSSRRKTKHAQIILNLVPILDTMVTLIGFLLFTMSFLTLVSVESPFPQASLEDLKQKLKEKPLQLTLTLRENDAEIWSPFEKFSPKKIPNMALGQPDLKGIHEGLVAVKQKFPKETKIVLVPYPGATYDILVATMDIVRLLDATDPALFKKNEKTGNDEPMKLLFPEVVFGNLLGDS